MFYSNFGPVYPKDLSRMELAYVRAFIGRGGTQQAFNNLKFGLLEIQKLEPNESYMCHTSDRWQQKQKKSQSPLWSHLIILLKNLLSEF